MSRVTMRLWWERATWVIPLLGVGPAVLLNQVIRLVDEQDYTAGVVAEFSASAAITILAAIGGGMITFTGFVFSFVVLLLQFGSSAYTPRSVAYFLRARAVQWILALFLATITFSFLTLIDTGSLNRADFVPSAGVLLAVLLLLASLIGFIALLHVVGRRIRVDAVLTSIGASAQSALRRRSTSALGVVGVSVGERATRALRAADPVIEPEQDQQDMVFYEGRNGQVVAIELRRLLRLVRSHSSHVELVVRVGDAVTPGTPVALVRGGTRQMQRAFSAAIIVDSERSLVHDPLYALRLLVDVALRALSPAVNDPTTAVRALDEIEAVLRVAAAVPTGAIRYDVGAGTLIVSRPSWTEVVDLALVEITNSAAREVQVLRRLNALVDDLTASVPVDHREVLREYRQQLHVLTTELPGRAGHIAGLRDRQGLGGSA
jgi:uncharacterized membrane protein